MKSSFALLVLGLAMGCAGAESTADIAESRDELTARNACRGKKEGASCSLCGTDPNCFETMEVKTCQKRGSRLTCKSGSAVQGPTPGSYDPCGGKRAGDSCSLCAPGDTDCFETMVEKSCDASGTCREGRPVGAK